MDRADQLHGALPGEASQPQADSPHSANAPDPAASAVGQPPTDAVPAHVEAAPTESLAAETKDVLAETCTPASKPMSEAAAAAPGEEAPCEPAASAAEATEEQPTGESRSIEYVVVEPDAAGTAAPHLAAADQPAAQIVEAPAVAFSAVESAAETVAVEQAEAQPEGAGPVVGEPASAEPALAEQIAAETATGAATVESHQEAQVVEGQAAAASRQPAEPAAEMPAEEKSKNMQWYVLKVQSNREETIREALLKRVKIAGLEKYFGEIIIPTEKVTEVKGGKKKVVTRKLYPGYLVAQMEINDDTWYLVRDTSGIGDFTGAAGRPSPMPEHEVARILAKHEEKSQKQPKLKIAFKPGDQVKIHEGTFENFEGQVESIDETNGRVTVMINIFGRSTPVELEYWQIGAV